MPYIDPLVRARLDDLIEALSNEINTVPGELNYCMTRLVARWATKRGLNYETLALATGVVENVKQEFYSRVAGPYEDSKMAENGDVREFALLNERIDKARDK